MTFLKNTGIAAIALIAAVTTAQAQATQDQDQSAHHPAAQPVSPAPSPQPAMMGSGPGGMMGGGMMGPGASGAGRMMQGGGFADPSAYLDSLKGQIGITASQEKPWNDYADVVEGTAKQMRALHNSMFESMGTQSWEQRRDTMNQMFAARQQAYANVHDAATQLLGALDDTQKAKAEQSLPGLAAFGPGMMRGRRP